jgi:hypothetical protein
MPFTKEEQRDLYNLVRAMAKVHPPGEDFEAGGKSFDYGLIAAAAEAAVGNRNKFTPEQRVALAPVRGQLLAACEAESQQHGAVSAYLQHLQDKLTSYTAPPKPDTNALVSALGDFASRVPPGRMFLAGGAHFSAKEILKLLNTRPDKRSQSQNQRLVQLIAGCERDAVKEPANPAAGLPAGGPAYIAKIQGLSGPGNDPLNAPPPPPPPRQQQQQSAMHSGGRPHSGPSLTHRTLSSVKNGATSLLERAASPLRNLLLLAGIGGAFAVMGTIERHAGNGSHPIDPQALKGNVSDSTPPPPPPVPEQVSPLLQERTMEALSHAERLSTHGINITIEPGSFGNTVYDLPDGRRKCLDLKATYNGQARDFRFCERTARDGTPEDCMIAKPRTP